MADISFDPVNAIATVSLETEVSGAYFRNVMEQVSSADEFPADVNVIWDVRMVDFPELDLDRINELKTVWEDFAGHRRGAVSAVVVTGAPQEYIIKLMLDVFGVSHTAVFDRFDLARAWIVRNR